MTLEEAQERILELTEQNQNLTTERDSLSQENETLKTESENLRKLNQKYFNRLIAQDERKTNDETNEPETVPTCEEFAANIDI